MTGNNDDELIPVVQEHPPLWIDRRGKLYRIEDMKTSHLCYALHMIERRRGENSGRGWRVNWLPYIEEELSHRPKEEVLKWQIIASTKTASE